MRADDNERVVSGAGARAASESLARVASEESVVTSAEAMASAESVARTSAATEAALGATSATARAAARAGWLDRKQFEDVVVGGVYGKEYFGAVASKEVRIVVGEDRRADEAAPLSDGEQTGNRRGHSHGEGNGRAGGGAAVKKNMN